MEVSTTSLFYSNATSMSDKVWQHVALNRDRHQHWAFVETHVSDGHELRDWQAKARGLHLRMHSNPARRTGKE
eukprot:8255271-Pyramimonas_sp.AAC.1